MEEKELYPKGTVQQTDDFALRQKIKKIVGENVEEIVKEETIKAFEELGYEEKDSYLFIVAAGGKDGKEKEVGKGAKEGKLNVTISVPKMLNMGATKPVSYMQKVTAFGGKKIVSEIYLEIIDKNVHIDYKNTESASFSQSSEKDTYAPNKLNKSGAISGIEEESKFKKSFKDFFKSIAKAEAEFLVGTKIGNDDKTEKNMNDSIVKENKYNMKLTDLMSSSYEDAGRKIENLVKESIKEMPDKEEKDGTPETSTGKPTDKKLVIGDEEKKLNEIGTAGGAGVVSPEDGNTTGQFGYLGKNSFKKENDTINESIKDTTYGIMRTPRAHLTRQNDGSYKVIAESLKTPYVELIKSKNIWPPDGMDKNHTMGDMLGAEVNGKEELSKTGHGELSEIEKIEEDYKQSLSLTKRKFSNLKENEEKGINKRYIITEKLSEKDQSRRWKELYECDCFCNTKDQKDTVSRDEFEDKANKEFEANNKPLESSLSDTPFSGEKNGFIDIPKSTGSMILFRLSESDARQNRTYVIDHFTNKLVLNPLYKAQQ